jgi:hypothetical protein
MIGVSCDKGRFVFPHNKDIINLKKKLSFESLVSFFRRNILLTGIAVRIIAMPIEVSTGLLITGRMVMAIVRMM